MPQIAGLRGVVPAPGKVAEILDAPPGERYAERLANATLVRDPSRAVYRYHQVFALDGRTVTRKALVCAIRLEPWADRQIRAHEVVEPAARAAELARITAVGTHVEPVLAGFRDNADEVERLFRGVDGSRPAYEHTTADGTIHRVFRSQSAEIIGPLRKLFAPKKLHVLDGHARYEAMLAYQAQLGAKHALAMYASANYGLGCLVNLDDPTVYPATAPRHRVVRGELDATAFLDTAKTWFVVEVLAGAARDVGKLRASLADTLAHQPAFVIALAGRPDAYKLTLRPDVSLTGEGIAVNRAIQKLEPVVLDRLIVPRLLKGTTLAVEANPAAAVEAVVKGATAAILMRAVPLDQIIHADELGELLPADSTAFYPRVATGLALPIDPDEDLV